MQPAWPGPFPEDAVQQELLLEARGSHERSKTQKGITRELILVERIWGGFRDAPGKVGTSVRYGGRNTSSQLGAGVT